MGEGSHEQFAKVNAKNIDRDVYHLYHEIKYNSLDNSSVPSSKLVNYIFIIIIISLFLMR